MIARVWRGTTRARDADTYAAYMRGTGSESLAATPGNKGVYMLRRIRDEAAEFVMISLWESEDAIRGFAGDDIDVAVFFPEDDRYLIERELTVSHYEVVEQRSTLV